MSINEIMSSLANHVPVSDFVYSSFGAFASRKGQELSGSWFTERLTPLGLDEPTIRTTLYRMEKSGALEARRDGRRKRYRATAPTLAVLAASRGRLSREPSKWDGRWTVVVFRFGVKDREPRERLREVLMVNGFGLLAPGVYVHPRDRVGLVRSVAHELRLDAEVAVIHGSGDVPNLWDLDGVAKRYHAFLRRFTPLRNARVTPEQAFGLRFGLMFEYFRTTWLDPDLPHELLPAHWPGEDARALAAELYQKWLRRLPIAWSSDAQSRRTRSPTRSARSPEPRASRAALRARTHP